MLAIIILISVITTNEITEETIEVVITIMKGAITVTIITTMIEAIVVIQTEAIIDMIAETRAATVAITAATAIDHTDMSIAHKRQT